MFSRARTCFVIAALAAVAALAVVSTAVARPAGSERPQTAREARQVAGLRHSIVLHRARTWRWQDRRCAPRAPTVYAERRTRSIPFLRWDNGIWNHRQKVAYRRLIRSRLSSAPASVPGLICQVFGRVQYPEGRRIAYNESRFETWAANGQYLGIFQMGSGERAAYATIGYGTAYEQIVAAHNLYLARGWEPWTCCGE